MQEKQTKEQPPRKYDVAFKQQVLQMISHGRGVREVAGAAIVPGFKIKL